MVLFARSTAWVGWLLWYVYAGWPFILASFCFCLGVALSPQRPRTFSRYAKAGFVLAAGLVVSGLLVFLYYVILLHTVDLSA